MNVQLAFLVFAFVLFAVPLGAEAQATGQRHRVGLLNASTPGGNLEAAFREGLRALGYVEGGNLKTVNALGLTLPRSVLARADRVIE